jgi:hypothetical protein
MMHNRALFAVVKSSMCVFVMCDCMPEFVLFVCNVPVYTHITVITDSRAWTADDACTILSTKNNG